MENGRELVGGEEIMEWLETRERSRWDPRPSGSRALHSQLTNLFNSYEGTRNNQFLLRIAYHAVKYCPQAMRSYRDRPITDYGTWVTVRAPDFLVENQCEQLTPEMMRRDLEECAVALQRGQRHSPQLEASWRAVWEVCQCICAHLFCEMTERELEPVIPLKDHDLVECIGVAPEFLERETPFPDLSETLEPEPAVPRKVRPLFPAGSPAARAVISAPRRDIIRRCHNLGLRVIKGGRS